MNEEMKLEQCMLERIADEYGERLREYRRYLHQNPELSFHEENTAQWVRRHLNELGIPVVEGIRGNSTVGILKGEKEGPTLLFRADIDALPITEETGLEYASTHKGVMHACGHDAHTATLMCFADFLSHHRDLIRGTVKFVFQQGEDCVPGGGKFIVEDGVLDDVDKVFAWHCEPAVEVGTVIATGGPRTASFSNFEINIKGKGGHGGFPFRSIDPISTGALVVSAINQMISWNVDPLESATMIVSRFEAGKHEYYNVIPENAVIEGNIRTHNNEVAEELCRKVKLLAEKICEAKGCECEFKLLNGYPALHNDTETTNRIRNALNENGIHAIEAKPIMGAEDFAFYTQVKPGTYFNVGTRNSQNENTFYPPHSSHFTIDENAMVYALETLVVTYHEMTRNSSDECK